MLTKHDNHQNGSALLTSRTTVHLHRFFGFSVSLNPLGVFTQPTARRRRTFITAYERKGLAVVPPSLTAGPPEGPPKGPTP
eukprot:683358-Prorocentrum_minimum.AAC.1